MHCPGSLSTRTVTPEFASDTSCVCHLPHSVRTTVGTAPGLRTTDGPIGLRSALRGDRRPCAAGPRRPTVKPVTDDQFDPLEEEHVMTPAKPTPTPAPGRPASRAPSLEEPIDPVGPLPPKPDQQGVQPRTATGAEPSGERTTNAQQGAFLTTSQGARLRDTDHSLKAGRRGPVLLQDHHLREKITPLRPRADPGACRARPRCRSPRRLPRATARRSPVQPGRVPGEGEAHGGLHPLLHGRRVPRLDGHRRATPGASPRSSTPTRAPSTWSPTTFRCSSSRTAIKFPDVVHAGETPPRPRDPAGAERP